MQLSLFLQLVRQYFSERVKGSRRNKYLRQCLKLTATVHYYVVV